MTLQFDTLEEFAAFVAIVRGNADDDTLTTLTERLIASTHTLTVAVAATQEKTT